jgi:preprotein translocase subunit SecG
MKDVITYVLDFVFVISAILLTAIVLMQEGKGGGLGSAFGGAGGEAFGHGIGGINRFTTVLAGIFMGSALILAFLHNKSFAS